MPTPTRRMPHLTVDELIAELEQLRAEYGGSLRVVVPAVGLMDCDYQAVRSVEHAMVHPHAFYVSGFEARINNKMPVHVIRLV